jgi:hypothetical protein
MLHKETVEPSTLELLIQLQEKSYLDGFYLVGGTALALRMGHRKSADLDLFSNFDFDAGSLLENLTIEFGFKLFFSSSNTLKGRVGSVELDIIAHRYPLIRKQVITEKIAMLSIEDIAAMKLNAIAVSGQRSKDFIDLYYLLEEFSMKEIISFYMEKYSQHNEVNILKSITWFEDVDLADWPVLLKAPSIKWEKIKERIVDCTKSYLNQEGLM